MKTRNILLWLGACVGLLALIYGCDSGGNSNPPPLPPITVIPVAPPIPAPGYAHPAGSVMVFQEAWPESDTNIGMSCDQQQPPACLHPTVPPNLKWVTFDAPNYNTHLCPAGDVTFDPKSCYASFGGVMTLTARVPGFPIISTATYDKGSYLSLQATISVTPLVPGQTYYAGVVVYNGENDYRALYFCDCMGENLADGSVMGTGSANLAMYGFVKANIIGTDGPGKYGVYAATGGYIDGALSAAPLRYAYGSKHVLRMDYDPVAQTWAYIMDEQVVLTEHSVMLPTVTAVGTTAYVLGSSITTDTPMMNNDPHVALWEGGVVETVEDIQVWQGTR